MVDRRQFLKGAGTASIAGLAGCLGGGGGSGDGNTLRIGLLSPFSGGYSFYGKRQERGIQVAFDRANESDELLPNTELELITADTKTDPEVGLSSARDLVLNQNVDHLMGATSSAVGKAIRNFVKERDMTFTLVNAASAYLTNGENCNRKTFRTHVHTGIFSEADGEWGTKNLGTDAYVLYQDYTFGYSVRDNVIKGIENAGGNVVGKAAKPLGGNQFGGVIQDVIETDPDWLFMGMYGTGGVPFYTQAASRGLDVPCHNIPPTPELATLTDEQFERLPRITSLLFYETFFDNEANREFLEAFEEFHGEEPTVIDENGYMPGRFVTLMLDEAGGADASLDEIIAAGEGMTFDAPRGTVRIRECDHQGIHPLSASEVTGVGGDKASLEVLEKVDTQPFVTPCDEIACQFES